jgi:hypothetical protein
LINFVNRVCGPKLLLVSAQLSGVNAPHTDTEVNLCTDLK